MLNVTKTVFSLVRELNFKAVQESAERPVRLVVTGDPELAAQLAGMLGASPWLSLAPDEAQGARQPGDVVLRVSPGPGGAEPPPAGGLELRLAPGAEAPAERLPGRVTLGALEPEALRRELAPALLERAPEALRLALARHLPFLRPAYATQLIEETSRANAIYAASTGVAELVPILNIPLNVADLVVLGKNQLMMAYKLALAEGKTGAPRTLVKEILSVVGGGFLFRQVARELIGLIPAWGLIPKVAVAYAGTWVIGRTVHLWASQGERAAIEDVRRSYQEALARGRGVAERLVARLREGRQPPKPEALEPPEEVQKAGGEDGP